MVPGDVSKEHEVKAIVNKAISTYGKLDILVSNSPMQYSFTSTIKFYNFAMMYLFTVCRI